MRSSEIIIFSASPRFEANINAAATIAGAVMPRIVRGYAVPRPIGNWHFARAYSQLARFGGQSNWIAVPCSLVTRPEVGRDSSQDWDTPEAQRDGRDVLKSGQMKGRGELEETGTVNFDIEFVAIAAPSPEQLNFVLCEASCCCC